MRAACLLFMLLSQIARAEEPSPSPIPTDDTAARQYYDLGAEAYEKGDYPAALRAFEAAWAEAPHAEFQFNIARCHERLGQWLLAAEAYQLYLQTKKNPPDTLEMRARIAELRLRAHDVATPQPPPARPDASFRVGALATLGATVVLVGAGTGTYLSAWKEYDSRSSACHSRCSPAEIDGLRTRVQTAQVGGAVLFSLAGVAAIVDIALWALDARARRR